MKRIFILLCLFFIIIANSFTTAKAQVNTTDSLALVDLYNSTNGPHWRTNTNWLTTNPVRTWYGITVTGSRVVKIYLYSNRLNGTIPSSIGNLTKLSTLSLTGNNLSGTLPASLFNLTALTGLDLSINELTGTIPAAIGNLVNLVGLNFQSNALTGNIPPEIGNLAHLSSLQLDVNQLSGTIPPEIGNIASLNYVDLEINGLSGAIPSTLGNLTHLSYLGLNQNQFTGAIPATLGNLTNLTTLYLSGNLLTGTIPATLGNLKNLSNIYLNGNQLSGAIPATLGNLTKLYTLKLDYNQLSGTVPASFYKLTKLNFFDISHNRLSAFGYTSTALSTNSKINGGVNNNLFTFDEVQIIAKHYHNINYAPQDTILPIHQSGSTLSVYAGGTVSNNTYIWYKVGSTTGTIISGAFNFTPSSSGQYYAYVTNGVAKRLTLYSDTVSYTMPLTQTKVMAVNVADVKTSSIHFSIYPNPASSIIHIQTNGTATIVLTNADGKVLLTKTINDSDVINVSSFANGVYYIQNKTIGEVQKVVVTH